MNGRGTHGQVSGHLRPKKKFLYNMLGYIHISRLHPRLQDDHSACDTKPEVHKSTRAGALVTSTTLPGWRATRVGPGQYPQYTRAPKAGGGCHGSNQNTAPQPHAQGTQHALGGLRVWRGALFLSISPFSGQQHCGKDERHVDHQTTSRGAPTPRSTWDAVVREVCAHTCWLSLMLHKGLGCLFQQHVFSTVRKRLECHL